ncbi:hypothetical protein [Nocardioides mesophilus]|uniref:Uncharacterized protein n=1 Tax=Nocardioides mesophilus TaxID=433659 RepID=A0A7G9R8C2_9ACTN|nr:hypothetical protein [Nocardioides mesophilus]QNN51847.1 hypothetical protein H9L09_15060 [Nocardioides mesophilus]
MSRPSTVRPRQRPDEQESTADPAPPGELAPARPVPFDRLLSVAVLTPAQACLIAVQLLDAARPSDNAGAGSHDDTRLADVILTSAGDLEVGRRHAEDGTPLTELLGQLLQNARRLPAHPRQEQLRLLHQLEQAVGDPSSDPGARARELDGVLTETLTPGARRRLPGQLAALVAAFAHVAPSVPSPHRGVPAPGLAPMRPHTAPVPVPRAAPTASGASRPDPPRAPAAGPAPSRPPRRGRSLLRRRATGRRVGLAVLVLAVVLAVSGYVMFSGPGVDIVGLGGNDPTAPTTTAPATPAKKPAKKPAKQPAARQQPAVPVLAGQQAGPITGVTVQKTGSCRPGALCPVKVTVRFRPSPTSRPVSWKVGAARACTRGITWSAPTTVTAQPGWTTVYASSSVRVPQGRSLALTALTTTPARAQSRPVPVAGALPRC